VRWLRRCGSGLTPPRIERVFYFQGVLNALPNMFYDPPAPTLRSLGFGSIFANQNYLASGFHCRFFPLHSAQREV